MNRVAWFGHTYQFEQFEERQVLTATPMGPEFLINTYTTHSQYESVVATDLAGNFTIAWTSGEQNEGKRGVYAQRFDAAGIALGGEFLVDANSGWSPAIAMSPEGGFVIAWSQYSGATGYDVYARRFDPTGLAQGSAFLVHTTTQNAQHTPDIAMDDAGNFVIVWNNDPQNSLRYHIYGRRFSADGQALGSEFQVSTIGVQSQHSPSIAMDSDGDFVVTWTSGAQNSSQQRIRAQRFDATGTKVGGEFQVQLANSSQSSSDVAMDASGSFVVVWNESGNKVHAKRYDASGFALGDRFQVSSIPVTSTSSPSVAMRDGGDFVVTWRNNYQVLDSSDIYGQLFRADGTLYDGNFRVNSHTLSVQEEPAVAFDENGNFVVSWTSNYQDGGAAAGSGFAGAGGIYAQRFRNETEPVVEIFSEASIVRGFSTSVTFKATRAPDQVNYAIDWDGDGTVDQIVSGDRSETVQHVFPDSREYLIRVTLTDSDGAPLASASATVQVVPWALRPNVFDESQLDLLWGGTAGDDAYAFLPGGWVFVMLENNEYYPVPVVINTGANGEVHAYGYGGNDLLLADVYHRSVFFFGGDGNDVLVGGRAGDVLDGGAGNDILLGGTQATDGTDSIFGGAGDDILVGHIGGEYIQRSSGEDLIIAGQLFFDNLPAAVYGIQAEWTSGRSYEERVANLTGTGINNLTPALVPGVSVLDDHAIDHLFGGPDQDWFIVDIDTDIILDLMPDELVLGT